MARRPVTNPLLTLMSAPQPQPTPGGGKGAKDIREDLYEARRKSLVQSLGRLAGSAALDRCAKAGRVLVRVAMEEQSTAPSYAPKDLFAAENDAGLVAPWRRGYLAEVSADALARLAEHVRGDHLTIATRVDISRISSVSLLAVDLLDQDFENTWSRASVSESGAKLFLASPAPFRSEAAWDALIADLARSTVVRRLRPNVTGEARLGLARLAPTQTDMPIAVGPFRGTSFERGSFLALSCQDLPDLRSLVASGAIVRWDPVRPLVPTRADRIGLPRRRLPALPDAPVVGIVDGGLLPGKYDSVEAWSEPALVPTEHAALEHGTRVASLVVEAEEWGNGLQLPSMPCRIGTVQAVADDGSPHVFDAGRFLRHVARAMSRHRDTRVWNVSANLPDACDEIDVSPLAHGLASIARKFDNTLVISAGNRSDEDANNRVSPPADCEAAIVVTGRLHDDDGVVAGACPDCRTGLGPDNMLTPQLSWFSTHASTDGNVYVGTSYAAPLVSRLAAHVWRHLRDPSADLVKAVLIAAADLDSYHHQLGFGSPISDPAPWESPPGAVVLAWKARLRTGSNYYWHDITLPSTMIDRNYLVGRLRLTAILAPEVTLAGSGNYFGSRLQTGLQYEDRSHRWKKLIGSMPVETAEGVARAEDAKWQPTRCYAGRFEHPDSLVRGSGLHSAFLGSGRLRIYARVFERDAFARPSLGSARERDHHAAFVLTMDDLSGKRATYDTFVRAMGNRVRSAVIDQEIPVDA